jgi:mannosyltransferase
MRSRNGKLFVGIMALTACLRLIAIQSRGIWYDDAFSVFLAAKPFGQIVTGTAADTMPPLYYFLLHAWMWMGDSVWLLRSLNVLISLGTVALVYTWISSMAGEKAGLWAALVTAVSPLQVYQAQELRMYALLTLALAGYAWFFMRLAQSDFRFKAQVWHWFGFVLCGTLAMYTHNLAIFTLIVPDVILLIHRHWKGLARLILAQALTGLAALPWLVMIPGQIDKIQRAFWTPRPGLVEIIQAWISNFTNLPQPTWLMYIAVLGSLWIMVFLALEYRRNHWWDEVTLSLVVFALVPPALMFAASYLMRPIFVPRAFMLSSLALYGLIARLAASGKMRSVSLVVGGLTVFLAVAGLPYQYTFNSFPRSPFQQADAYLEKQDLSGTLVLHDNKLSYFPMHFYDPKLPGKFLPDAPGSGNDTLAAQTASVMGLIPEASTRSAIAGAERVAFVDFAEAEKEYTDQGVIHPVLAELQEQFKLVGKTQFNDINIYFYER